MSLRCVTSTSPTRTTTFGLVGPLLRNCERSKSENSSNLWAPSCEASAGLQNKLNSQTSGSTRVESRNQHIFEASHSN